MVVQVIRNEGLLGAQTPKSVPVVHNVQILDASGSMSGGKYNTALAGINKEISLLKGMKDGVEYRLSVIEFDTSSRAGRAAETSWTGLHYDASRHHTNIMPHFWCTPIEKAHIVGGYGAHGGTPLYYTAWEVIQRLRAEMKQGEVAVVTILTDGQENESPAEFRDGRKLKSLIDEVKDTITVTFMGTQFDIEKVVRDTGISYGNTYTHYNTADTINTAYAARGASLTSFSKNVASGSLTNTANFFSGVSPISSTTTDLSTVTSPTIVPPRKRRGRPVGSRNKPKNNI